jgi:hypothetical protein
MKLLTHKCSLKTTKKLPKELIDGILLKSQKLNNTNGKKAQLISMTHLSSKVLKNLFQKLKILLMHIV